MMNLSSFIFRIVKDQLWICSWFNIKPIFRCSSRANWIDLYSVSQLSSFSYSFNAINIKQFQNNNTNLNKVLWLGSSDNLPHKNLFHFACKNKLRLKPISYETLIKVWKIFNTNPVIGTQCNFLHDSTLKNQDSSRFFTRCNSVYIRIEKSFPQIVPNVVRLRSLVEIEKRELACKNRRG